MEIKGKQVTAMRRNHCSVVGGRQIGATPKVPSGGSHSIRVNISNVFGISAFSSEPLKKAVFIHCQKHSACLHMFLGVNYETCKHIFIPIHIYTRTEYK